jgi:hypothetical protein
LSTWHHHGSLGLLLSAGWRNHSLMFTALALSFYVTVHSSTQQHPHGNSTAGACRVRCMCDCARLSGYLGAGRGHAQQLVATQRSGALQVGVAALPVPRCIPLQLLHAPAAAGTHYLQRERLASWLAGWSRCMRSGSRRRGHRPAQCSLLLCGAMQRSPQAANHAPRCNCQTRLEQVLA